MYSVDALTRDGLTSITNKISRDSFRGTACYLEQRNPCLYITVTQVWVKNELLTPRSHQFCMDNPTQGGHQELQREVSCLGTDLLEFTAQLGLCCKGSKAELRAASLGEEPTRAGSTAVL